MATSTKIFTSIITATETISSGTVTTTSYVNFNLRKRESTPLARPITPLRRSPAPILGTLSTAIISPSPLGIFDTVELRIDLAQRIMSDLMGLKDNFLSTACSCIETQRPCSVEMSTVVNTLRITATAHATAATNVAQVVTISALATSFLTTATVR